MDLLRPSELPVWLLAKFNSANELATKLGLTRQTAHNLLNGKTIPSYETCDKLGLDLVFLLKPAEEKRKMAKLDEFLSKRERERTADEMRGRVLREQGPGMWDALKEATQTTAARVGNVDGDALEWNQYPFLKLKYVAASFTPGMLAGGLLKGCRIIFGRIPTAMYIDDNPIPTTVWDLTVSVNGDQLGWDVNGGEVLGLSTAQLAEQLIMRLIEYRDEYQAACRRVLLG